jgi:hypothetical protein
MKQSEFKKAIFENRQVIKDKTANLYDNKKLYKLFMEKFDKIDLEKFDSMDRAEQKKLMAELFGNPEQLYGDIIKTELKKAQKLAADRIATKRKE